MTAIVPQNVDLNGLKPTYGAVAASDTMQNDGHTILHVKNGNAAACVVTIDSLAACSQGSDHNEGASIPAGEDHFFGPFDRTRFNDPNGDVGITYSVTPSVTVAALKVN